jgi:hypothetical protein
MCRLKQKNTPKMRSRATHSPAPILESAGLQGVAKSQAGANRFSEFKRVQAASSARHLPVLPWRGSHEVPAHNEFIQRQQA